MAKTELQILNGSIFLEEYSTDGSLGDKFYPGKTDSLAFNTAVETIEHYDTEDEEQVLDGEDVVKRTTTLSFTTSDINDKFNAIAYLAEVEDMVQEAQTNTAVVIATAKAGKVEDLGYKSITDLVVKNAAGDVTYVENTDYTFSKKWGSFIALSGGAIADDSEIHVTLSADAVAGKSLESFSVDKKNYRLTYEGVTAAGRNERHVFEKVSISMEGDRTLKSGDKTYTLINFTGAVLKENGKTHTMDTF